MKNLIIVLLLLCLSPFEGLPQKKRVEKRSQIGAFYLKFPSNPTYVMNDAFHLWITKDKNDQVTYMAFYAEDPSGKQVSVKAVKNDLISSMMSGDIQIQESNLKYQGFNGVEFLYRTPNRPTLYKKGRVIVKDSKLYILQIYYYNQDLIEYELFVNSLGFLN